MTTKTAKDNSTPTRPIRVPLDLWDEFGDVAGELGSNRTALILEFMRWMVRRPGARLPRRPADAPPAASSSA